jgi:hypothetical protein
MTMTTARTFARSNYHPKGAVRVEGAGFSEPVTLDFSTVAAGALIFSTARLSVDDMNAARKAAGLAPIAQWQMAFEDQAADHMPSIPAGFVDVSWHNDMCPAFESAALGLTVWIDHSDPQRREFPESHRFAVYEGTSETGQADSPVLTADDWSEVVAFIAAREGRDPEAARAAFLEQLAKDAAEAASNAMALTIQQALGVESGDLAALWFCGEPESTLEQIARDYITTERNHAES